MVRVELSNGHVEAGTAGRPLMLIGTRSSYIFLLRTREWRSVVIPTEAVVRILPETEAAARKRLEPRLPSE